MNYLKKLNQRTLFVALLSAFTFSQLTSCKDEETPSNSKQITAFVFEGLNPVTTGTIDESNHTISIEVPVDSEITSLVPTITISDKATVNPASGVPNNFAAPVTYTVKAEDGTTQTYTVTVVSPDKKITAFKFEALSPVVEGTIDENSHSILVKVPYNTDVTALTPTISIRGKEISPALGTPQDFTNPVTYTVTATNGGTQAYSVKVEVLPVNTASVNWAATDFHFSFISSLAVSGKDIFVGHSGGVSRSSNGTAWTSVTTGTAIMFVGSTVVSGNTIYVGTDTGIFTSNDNGSNWISILTVPTGKSVYSILVHDSNIFASSFGKGIYLSTNNGTDWALMNDGLTSLSIISLGTSGTNLFASASNSDGSFLSTNAGSNWTPISTLPGTSDFVTVGDNSFAATRSGVYMSADDGASWTAVNSGLTDLNVNTLYGKDGNLFAGTNGGVFLSTNNGTSWTPINKGLPDEGISAIVIKGSTIFAATSSGVYSSPL